MIGAPAHGPCRVSVNALDVARGIAIVSVMYGHALAPWFMSPGGPFSEAAFLQWKFGASFMMALFFFLSGLSWRNQRSLTSTVRQSIALILIALLVSTVYDFGRMLATLAGITPLVGAQEIDFWTFLAGVGRMALFGDYYSFSALWFLVALALVRVLAGIVARMGGALGIAFAAGLLALSLVSTELGWRNVYQINLIGVAFVFFLAGHAARTPFHVVENRPQTALALMLLGGAILVTTFDLNQGCRWDVSAQCGVAWLNNRFGVAMIIGQFGNLPMFALTALAGVTFVCALSVLLARYGGVLAQRLDKWGGNSLNLLIVNCIFLHIGNQLVERWIAPRIDADSGQFFVSLFMLTLAANIAAVHLLERPLRLLHRAARTVARRIVDVVDTLPSTLAWAQRGDRVSQRND